jgi:hypothetical protein
VLDDRRGFRAGLDVRLILPWQGCLLCVGGLDLETRHEIDGRRERAGSLRSLNSCAVSLGWFLVERLVAGDLDRTVWRQMVFDREGHVTTEEPTFRLRPRCPICAASGQGDSAWVEQPLTA